MINALKNIGIHIYLKSSSRKNAHLSPFGGKNARIARNDVPFSAKRVFWENVSPFLGHPTE
jgi:hypothetical protein